MPMSKTYLTVNGQIRSEQRHGESGSRDFVTDALGNIVAVYRNDYLAADACYRPYGTIHSSWNMDTHGYRFTWIGSLGYAQTGRAWSNVYVRARHYTIRSGNWTTVDPLWPQEAAYGYVRGRGMGAVDPSGMQTCALLLHIAMYQEPGPHCKGCDLKSDSDVCSETARLFGKRASTLGAVACCGSRLVTCTWQQNLAQGQFKGTSSRDMNTFKECITAHEKVHIDQLKKGETKCVFDGCGWVVFDRQKGMTESQTECPGYLAELACLIQKAKDNNPCKYPKSLYCNRALQVCAAIKRFCGSNDRPRSYFYDKNWHASATKFCDSLEKNYLHRGPK